MAAPPGTCGRGLGSLAGLWGRTGGSVRGFPGLCPAPPVGTWAPGLAGAALLQRKRVWPVLGSECPLVLHTGWGPAPGAPGARGCPPAGPRSLALLAQRPLVCTLAISPLDPRPAHPVLGGALACHTDPLSFAFSCVFLGSLSRLGKAIGGTGLGQSLWGAGLRSGRVRQTPALELRGDQVGVVWVHNTSPPTQA